MHHLLPLFDKSDCNGSAVYPTITTNSSGKLLLNYHLMQVLFFRVDAGAIEEEPFPMFVMVLQLRRNPPKCWVPSLTNFVLGKQSELQCVN